MVAAKADRFSDFILAVPSVNYFDKLDPFSILDVPAHIFPVKDIDIAVAPIEAAQIRKI